MKIAVTASGPSKDDRVDERFGRAAWFVIHDTESGSWTTVDNSKNKGAGQGAGIQSGQRIADSGASVLLTGHCGPNAFQTLSTAGIKVVTGVSGTVEEAVKKYEKGEFERAGGPDVAGHWS